MSQSKINLKYGEFFSGPGGMALGISRLASDAVHITHNWAFDIDEDAVATYNRNIANVCQVADVRSLDIASLEKVDLFTFGFPCNDFSVVGEQLGLRGSYGPLYSFGVQLLDVQSPMAFIAENVSGLASANDGQAFRDVLDSLQSAGAGYDVFPHLYCAEHYGVPQTRKRILIVGIRKDLDLTFSPPYPTHTVPMTVRDALVLDPIPADASNNELTRQSHAVIERLKYIRPGENAFTAEIPENLRLNVAGAKISQIYRRLDPNRPSYTITGSGGGGTHVYHWEENRALTNRERARLQSFPDDFVFMGSKESVRKQIGMAVPPLLAQAVGQALVNTLMEWKYPTLRPNLCSDGSKGSRNAQYQPGLAYEELSSYKSVL